VAGAAAAAGLAVRSTVVHAATGAPQANRDIVVIPLP